MDFDCCADIATAAMATTQESIIKFCNVCKKRVGPVSSTHASTGGSEAQCQCVQDDSHLHSDDTTKETKIRNDEEEFKRKRGKAMQARSAQADAARAVRRWAKSWREELGNDGFPNNMRSIAHLTGFEIYKQLGLDQSLERRNYIDNAVLIQQESSARKLEWTIQQAMIKYRHTTPPFFNPFSVDCPVDTDHSDKDRIWWLLTDAQRASLIREESEAAYAHQTSRTRGKAENTWYAKCIRLIEGGKEAIRNNERYNNKKKHITHYLQQAQSNVRRKLTMSEKTDITRFHCGCINDIDFDIDAESF